MRKIHWVIIMFAFVVAFSIAFAPTSLAKEPAVIWQSKLTNKELVLDGVTTSKNETIMASYTLKNKVKQYQLFKVNHKTAKVKNLAKLSDGELYFFDLNGKAYIVHREKRKLTVYDESFKAVHKKTWTGSYKFTGLPIQKSKADSSLVVIGDYYYNYTTKKNEPLFVALKQNSKGKFAAVAQSKLPGESFYISRPDAPVIKQQTLMNTDTSFSLKLDTKTVPNYKNGFRSSFSSMVVKKYNNHFYLFLRENSQGDGAERLLKVNSKGKVVSHVVMPGDVASSPEPFFIGGQAVMTTFEDGETYYYIVNLDTFKMTKLARDSFQSNHTWLTSNLYSLNQNNEYQFFNKAGKRLYTLPESVFVTKNEQYGIHIQANYKASTVYNLNTGKLLASLKTGHVVSFQQQLLAVEQKSGYKQAKLYKLN